MCLCVEGMYSMYFTDHNYNYTYSDQTVCGSVVNISLFYSLVYVYSSESSGSYCRYSVEVNWMVGAIIHITWSSVENIRCLI